MIVKKNFKNRFKMKISKEEIEFKDKFYNLMFELDLYNKFKKTYLLDVKKKTNYGYHAYLYLVPGLSFDMLADKKTVIEQNLKCLWIMETKSFREYAEVQIVFTSLGRINEAQYLDLATKSGLAATSISIFTTLIKSIAALG